MASLKDEIRQTKPFRSVEEEAYIALRLTSQVVDQPWVRYLRQAEGISPSQYNLLRILRGAGLAGRTMSEISERMINRDPDATRLADRMIRHGLVRRMRDTDDRRFVRLFITQDGLDMVERLDDTVDEFLRHTLAGLGEKDLRKLTALLEDLRAGMLPFPPGQEDG